ncbi:MAG: hypothetical protein GY696_34335 [Gammaproteobacteria bacterium]|nr:hypothetical protein [Gammaproteobacteria bacterium]
MSKKYHVTLTDKERDELEGIIKKRSGKSLPVIIAGQKGIYSSGSGSERR